MNPMADGTSWIRKLFSPVSPSAQGRSTVATPEQAATFVDAPFAPGKPLDQTLSKPDGTPAERAYDYPVAFNMQWPGMEETPQPVKLSARDLRWISRSWGLLRIAIETKKGQVLGQSWAIRGRDGKEADPNRVAAAQLIFRKPDGDRSLRSWLGAFMEDLFVLDFNAIRVEQADRTYFQQVDPSTIKKALTIDGTTPRPPEVAYQQFIKGSVAADYDTTEMVVAHSNRPNDSAYGYSAVQQIMDIIDLGIRRQLHQTAFFTEGNLPENIIKGPEGWTPKQIAEFQGFWDAMYEGPNAQTLKRRTRFVMNGMDIVQSKDPVLKDEMDDWLARVICYAFQISPSALTKDNNRSVGETIHEMNQRQGLEPVLAHIEEVMTDLLERAGYADLEFAFEEEQALDPKDKASVDQIYLTVGVLSPNEVREGLGLKPREGGDEYGSAAAPAASAAPANPFAVLFGKSAVQHQRLLAKAQKKSPR